jgi:hypothetical protein
MELGQLIFFSHVDIPHGDSVRTKVVRLGSISCERSECVEKLKQFRELNDSNVRFIRAEFVLRDYF